MNQKHRASCTGGGRRARSLAALALVSLIAGCSAVVEGAARPTADLIARSLTGSTIRQVLLADDALSRILNRSFRIDPRFPPRFGGPETLQDDGWDAPGDCLGVAAMLQRVVYQSGQVRHVAVETWRHAPNSVEVTSVREGVVSLTSAAEARALFAKFAQQWQHCDGMTMPLSGTVFRLQAMANNVEVADSLVAATVSMGFASRTLDSAAIPSGRALGVRGNCLVEVEVAFFGNPQHHPQPTEPVAADPRSSAVDIARAILENVGAQS